MDNLLHPDHHHLRRCPRCQSQLNTVVENGHEQCSTRKSNIFECCSGDKGEADFNQSIGYKKV